MPSPDTQPEKQPTPPEAPKGPEQGTQQEPTAEELERKRKEGEEQARRTAASGVESVKADVQVDQNLSTTPSTAPQTPPGTPKAEKPKGFLAALSGGWAALSKWLTDSGKSIGDWFYNLLGIKQEKTEELVRGVEQVADQAKQTAEHAAENVWQHVKVLLDQLKNSKAQFFSFKKEVTAQKTSDFGDRIDPMDPEHKSHRFHAGIDVGVAEGTELVSTVPGKIKRSYWSNASGNVVEFEREDGLIATYHHLKNPGPPAGTQVEPGDVFAYTGSTGARSTGPHLHFGIMKNGENIDPAPYLNLA